MEVAPARVVRENGGSAWSSPRQRGAPLKRHNITLVALLAITPALACNAILGNEKRTLAEDDLADGNNSPPAPGPTAAPTTSSERTSPPPDEQDAAPTDAGADAAPIRMPAAGCVRSTTPKDNTKKVELDLSPTPIRNETDQTVSAYFTIYGDNGLTNVRLDFCTPDGAQVDPGGGFNYLGSGAGFNHRWQTKKTVKLPFGRTQAQVIADGSPSLKLVWDIDVK